MGKVVQFSGLLLSIFLVLEFLVPSSEAAATREILNSSNRNKEQGKIQGHAVAVASPKTCSQIESLLSLVTSIPGIIIQLVGNFTGGLGDLISKPGGGISLPSFNKTSIIGGGGGGCSPIDPLLIANVPGIFIAVPIVIIGIAILIAIIVAIVVAIGGLGGDLTKMASDMMGFKNHGGDDGGYAPSIGPSYGPPVSSYGSPVAATPYSRLSQTVATATQDFNNAYDKYSALMAQPQQPQQPQQSSQQSSSGGPVYYDQPGQYDGWNSNNEVSKRMKH